MIQMWELTHENFKTAIIKILQQASQTLKINRKVEMSRKEIEDLKKNQMDILELKNWTTKYRNKHLTEWVGSTMEATEETVKELEDG